MFTTVRTDPDISADLIQAATTLEQWVGDHPDAEDDLQPVIDAINGGLVKLRTQGLGSPWPSSFTGPYTVTNPSGIGYMGGGVIFPSDRRYSTQPGFEFGPPPRYSDRRNPPPTTIPPPSRKTQTTGTTMTTEKDDR